MDKSLVNRLREDTPGCTHVLHLNNAGAALSPRPVIDATKQHLDKEALMGGYEAALASIEDTESVYKNAAQLINCNPDEIAFVENATRAWDMAFYSFKFKPGDKILTATAEYASNYLAFLQMAKHTGVEIEVIKNDASGQLDLEDLKNKLDAPVKLIAITHVPTQGGLINPAQAVGKLAQAMGIPYLLDTTQSIGQMPIDVEAIGCDFLCATGRKYLRGPRGTGFLYAREKTTLQYEPPFIDLHSAKWISDNDYVLRRDARRFETWEQNIAAKIGLGVALRYALELGLSTIWDRIQHLSSYLRQQLSQMPSIQLQDLGSHHCGIVTFTCREKSPTDIQTALLKQKINVSISLEEYARLDLSKRNISSLVRASVHYYNTIDELDTFCKALERILCKQ